MKYKAVRIFQTGGTWDYTITPIAYDRDDKPHKPSALGYYYCQETTKDAEALEALKACMIDAHKKKIARLTKSLEALCALEVPRCPIVPR